MQINYNKNWRSLKFIYNFFYTKLIKMSQKNTLEYLGCTNNCAISDYCDSKDMCATGGCCGLYLNKSHDND